MLKQRIKILVACFMMFFCTTTFANYPVIDVSNLINAINQLYATYDQINAAIEQVQNTYQQLEKQAKAMKNMNWDNLQASFAEGNWSDNAWENIGNFRKNLTNATSAINDNLNLVNEIKNTLENKAVSFGGKKYSVGGLFGIGQYGENNLLNMPFNMYDYAKETGQEAIKGWTEGLTYAQKERIMRKWGLDPENYGYVKLVEEQANELIKTLITEGDESYYKALVKQIGENHQAIMDMSNAAGESYTAQAQATTGAILALDSSINNVLFGIKQWGALFSKETTRKQVQEEAQKEAAIDRLEQLELEAQKKTANINGWM